MLLDMDYKKDKKRAWSPSKVTKQNTFTNVFIVSIIPDLGR